MPSAFDRRLSPDPVQQFRRWFGRARQDKAVHLPEAMCLSTINARGYPSARMVLLKDVDGRGFTFFTNIHSPKAGELTARPHAALTFYWGSQGRQVRIEGKVTRLPKKVADAYFATRARDSQIGSWASRQSEPLESRAVLLEKFAEWAAKFKGQKIPPSPHWHGFRITPQRMEFWQERPHRLHDRWVYVKRTSGRWGLTRLYP
jgi:pyridoxamine 5'-phosphate oxidase